MGPCCVAILTVSALFTVYISEIKGKVTKVLWHFEILDIHFLFFPAFSIPLLKNEYVSASLHPQMKREKEGSRASLTCDVTPDDDYKIDWMFKGGKIQAKATLDKLQKTLEIPFLTLKDAGAYVCKATNMIGQTQMAATVLDVIGVLHLVVKISHA